MIKDDDMYVYNGNLSDCHKILQYATESKIDGFTHTPKDQKELKMVLKNISFCIEEEEIQKESTSNI